MRRYLPLLGLFIALPFIMGPVVTTGVQTGRPIWEPGDDDSELFAPWRISVGPNLILSTTPNNEIQISAAAGGGTGDITAVGDCGSGDCFVTGGTASTTLLSTSGTLTVGGVDNTNNEDLLFDFETTENMVHISSSTGIATTYWDGDFFVQQEGDNRTATDADTDPRVRVLSSDAAQAADFIEIFHDQADGIIRSGNGDIRVRPAGNDFWLQFTPPDIVFADASSNIQLIMKADPSTDQFVIGIDDLGGNQVIISNRGNLDKDHDHALTTDPTLFIHSDKDPDTDNTEYLALSHDQSDAIIASGSGSIKFDSAANVFFDVGAATDGIVYSVAGTQVGYNLPNSTTNQWIFAPTDDLGNQFILTNSTNRGFDHAHATTTDPTMFIHSDNQSTSEYLSLSHDQNDAIVFATDDLSMQSNENLHFRPDRDGSGGTVDVAFFQGTGVVFNLRYNDTTDQTLMGVEDAGGNQLILTNDANASLDHDHTTQTNPTLFVHSDKSPDTDNTEYLSLAHDQTNAVFNWGSGALDFDGGDVNITAGDLEIATAGPDITLNPTSGTAYGWHVDPGGEVSFFGQGSTHFIRMLTSGALQFPNLADCDTIDTDSLGNLACGTDETSAGGGDPVLISGSNVTDSLGIDFIGGTSITITHDSGSSPETATFAVDDDFVKIAGDTMTGDLTLTGTGPDISFTATGGDTFGLHAETTQLYMKDESNARIGAFIDSDGTAGIGRQGFLPTKVVIQTDGTGESELSLPSDSVDERELNVRHVMQITVLEAEAPHTTGNGKAYLDIDNTLEGFNLVSIHCRAITAGTTGDLNVDVALCEPVVEGNACSGTVNDVLSTNLTIPTGRNDSRASSIPPVIDIGRSVILCVPEM